MQSDQPHALSPSSAPPISPPLSSSPSSRTISHARHSISPLSSKLQHTLLFQPCCREDGMEAASSFISSHVHSLLYNNIDAHAVVLILSNEWQGELDGHRGNLSGGRWRSSETAKRFRTAVPTDASRIIGDIRLASRIPCNTAEATSTCVWRSNCRRRQNGEPVSQKDGGCSFLWSRTANLVMMEDWGVDFFHCQQQLHSLIVIIMQ